MGCAGSRRDAAQIALVCVAIAAPLTAVLVERGSVGPVSYVYTDVNGYVAEQDAALRTSLSDADENWANVAERGRRFGDLTQWNWALIASLDQNLDAAPLNASTNKLLGLRATETFSPFLVALLLAGALAAFRGGARPSTRSATWAAVLAGSLFSGALFLELWFDAYQAAIIGIGMVMPVMLMLAEVLRTGRRKDIVVLALLLATIATVYPLFQPVLVVTGGTLLLWRGWEARRAGVAVATMLRAVLPRAGLLVGLMVLFNPVAIARNVGYYQKVLGGGIPLPRVPWTLLDIIPGWVLQTRGFWAMPPLSSDQPKQLILGALIPLAWIALIVFGLRRFRAGLLLVLRPPCSAPWRGTRGPARTRAPTAPVACCCRSGRSAPS